MATTHNIDAIKKLLDGTHKSQTKTNVSFADIIPSDSNTSHNIGDTWTDEHGIEWEQRTGYQIKKSKLEEIRKEYINKHSNIICPVCGKKIEHWLDKEAMRLEEMCQSCYLKRETEMKINGTFGDYIAEKSKRNARYFIKESEYEMNQYIEDIRKLRGYVNEDGTMQKWEFFGVGGDEIIERIKKTFKDFKQDFCKRYDIEDELTQ